MKKIETPNGTVYTSDEVPEDFEPLSVLDIHINTVFHDNSFEVVFEGKHSFSIEGTCITLSVGYNTLELKAPAPAPEELVNLLTDIHTLDNEVFAKKITAGRGTYTNLFLKEVTIDESSYKMLFVRVTI